MKILPSVIENHLLTCWSIKTSSKWTIENPYRGQCGVTAVVIYELFGGEILKTRVDEQWHYYNRIEVERIDFTKKQFAREIDYADIHSNRDEAFSDTNESQYQHLKRSMEKSVFGISDVTNSEHYIWGIQCDGWHLVQTPGLSVIKEMMPAHTSENLHYHKKAQQYFYILSGSATFEINGQQVMVTANRGISIKSGMVHRILNSHDSDLEFLVISQPPSHGDRVNLEKNEESGK